MRAQAQGIVGKSMLHEVRLQVYRRRAVRLRSRRAPTIIVLDAFTKGGAGVSREGSSRVFELAENLDFNVGRKQQMRVGFLLDGGRYENFDAQNAAGTYTYATHPGLQRQTAADRSPSASDRSTRRSTNTRWASTGRTTSG